MKLKELLNYSKKYLENNNIEDAILISKLLVQYIMGISKDKIIIYYDKNITDIELSKYKKLLDQIVKGVPIQYIIKEQEFMKLDFYVDENVLIPQPDTEILVEEVIKKYMNKSCEILDLCTGSGAIAVSLAKYIEKSSITASDLSKNAIEIAKLNAKNNNVDKKITFIESNMFEKIKYNKFDVIVSNPPYIESDEIAKLSLQVKSEPYMALDGGMDGLDFYRIIIDNSYKYIKDCGNLFLEIGYNQKDKVFNLLKESNHYEDYYCIKDLSENDRAIVATVRR